MRRRPPRRVLALCAAFAACGCLESPPGADTPGPAPVDGGGDCPGNLASNGSFEEGTAGWSPIFATAVRIEAAFGGVYAMEICSDGTSDVEGYYSFDDNPSAVENPSTEEIYRVRAWVRAGPQTGPQSVEVVIREIDEAGDPHPRGTGVSPDETWQEVTSMLMVESAAPQSVDVYVASANPMDGNCFHLDEVCVQRVE